MTKDYTIDISKNSIPTAKIISVTGQVYTWGFLFIGIFSIIYSYVKKEGWGHLNIALICFLLFITRYLQLKRIWIYKTNFSINTTGIKWQKTIFSSGNIKWVEMKQIHFQFPNINFELTLNRIKTFSLDNITVTQIETIKFLLAQHSIEHNVKFTAV